MFATALLTVGQMAAADRAAVVSGVSGFDLMGNAGQAVAREILQRFSPCPVVVLCGPGNNGGDGFVVARVLAGQGWPVRLALLGSVDRLPADARAHAGLWSGAIEALSPDVVAGARLVVDAIFGAGLNRPLSDDVLAVLAAIACPIVAVDVPSGVSGDTGSAEAAPQAVLTVTFFRKKPGHVLLPGRLRCGEIVVADIGINAAVLTAIQPSCFENDPGLWRQLLPRPSPQSYKYSRGHALLAGGYPMTGAARLSARAAARAGAGATTIVVPEVALPIYAASSLSVMVQTWREAGDFAKLLVDPRLSALLIGPGAGISEATRGHALAMLATGRAVVLDADVFSVFADDPAALFAAIRGPCVMTPHEGEFRRIFAHTGAKTDRAVAAARDSKAVIVLKGADTVIAAPDGRCVINANAPPTLATAGAGDVLAGIVLGLLAQGMPAFDAACAAVWLHGAAATSFGAGLIADDLPDLLPAVLRELAASG